MSIVRRSGHTPDPKVGHVTRALAIAALAVSIATLQASTPRFFQAAAQRDFLGGDVENLSIDSRGQLVLGPATEMMYETPSPFLWALAPGPNGTLFLGTGNEGRVFRVDAQGRGTSFFDADELEVHAVAPAPDGGLYAASSPDGRIYKIDRTGAASTFFDPEDKYIWALVTDSKGNLFAATGDKGIVYKITPNGAGAPFYRTRATHATALAVDAADNVLVGTDSPGRLFRVTPDGRGFLLLDTPFDEIRALRVDARGLVYVAAVRGRAASGSAPTPTVDTSRPAGSEPSRPGGVPTVTVESSASVVASPSSGGASSGSDDGRTARGALYRIAPDGLWDELWSSRDDLPYDVITDDQGRLIVATGNKGKIFRLEGDPLKATLLARAEAQQVTALYKDLRGAVYYATANPGKLFRLSSGLAPRGTYVSGVQDAKMVASWGVLSWKGTTGGGRIEISTRSGNSEPPDETWSPWSVAYATSGAAITSPKARYLQWRVVLTSAGQSPVLTSITAAYLQRNVRPDVTSITVHPPGVVFQKPFPSGDPDLAGFDNQTTPDRRLAAEASSSGSPSLGRRVYAKGLQTLVWRAADENGDDLVYDVDYRREGDAAWKPLRRGMTDSIHVWDTTTVLNGTYFVRVRASDLPSNGTDTALAGELDSEAFEIDNTPPLLATPVVRAETNRTFLTFEVTDDHSPIQRVEVSRDGLEWSAVFPKDGIADSRIEHYEVFVEGPLGPRGLSLRATDAMNNVATTQVEAPARRQPR